MLGWELPPHNSGGLGVACYQLCSALSKNGVDIEFILPYSARHDESFMKVTPAVPHDVTMIQKSGMAYDSYKYVMADGSSESVSIYEQQARYEAAVAELVFEKSFDVIHAHDWLTFRAALRAKQITNKPLILHVHALESDRAAQENGGNPMVREIEYLALHMADKVIAVSELTKKAMVREYHIPADKIDVVHNSLDISTYEDLEVQNAYHYLSELKTQGYRVVSNIGRITMQKGLPNLLQAFRLVVAMRPKTMLLVVGSGEQLPELISLSAQLGIGQNILFADFQRGKRWRDAFAIADLFVMPSISEPFGLTPLEAALYGTPSLISKQSGVTEVLKSALKVDFWDVNQMANQITSALNNPAVLYELRENALKECLSMSWHKAAKHIHELYEQHASPIGATV